ncbi:class E sortase [Parafrankia sp. EUN1f]|uniref:class E sortase n=1 Tax=Parafrankia sp. EUN1f TaxID=102897 RepID=UPI0001C44612|nr:class E sortase [Parafrankia sp. EUN1f]EFC85864.1 sortase family protein [Parafrankia sp. EUN1f]
MAAGTPGEGKEPGSSLSAPASPADLAGADRGEVDARGELDGLDSLDDLMGGPDPRNPPVAAVPAQGLAPAYGPARARGRGYAAPELPAADPLRDRTVRSLGGHLARGAGELMITCGVIVVLFLCYQLWITDIFAARTQDQIRHDLTTAWAQHAVPKPARGGGADPRKRPSVPPVELGDGIAVLRVPRFGTDYAPVVVEGVSTADLRRGPGHFPGSAMPGEIGNFVVSGHRTTYGKPFSRVDELKVGDPIVVEVADRYFTYRVTRSEIVDPHRLDVTYPVPGHLGEAPTKARMTLTTCHPRFSAKSRLIVFAELDETRDKSDGPPPELTGG